MLDTHLVHFQPNLFAFCIFATGFCTHILGFVALVRERASKASISLFSLCWFCGIWLMCIGVALCMQTGELAEPWLRVAVIMVCFIPSALWAFVIYITEVSDRYRLSLAVSMVLSVYFAGTILTDLLFSGVYSYSWGFYPKYTWAYLSFLAFLSWSMTRSCVQLWRAFKQTELQTQKKRLKLILIGLLIAYFAIIDFLPGYGVPIYPFGFVLIFSFLCTMVYAIWRYRVATLSSAFASDQILEMIHDSLLVFDYKGRIRLMNHAAQKLCGKRIRDLAGEVINSLQFVGENSPKDTRELAKKDEFKDHEGTWIVDGRTLPVSASMSLLNDVTGERIGSVLLLRDISRKKNLEEQLVNLSRAVEQSPCVIMITDIAGRVEYINQKGVEDSGKRKDELLGHSYLALRAEAPNEETQTRVLNSVISGQDWRGEVQNMRKGGEKYWTSEYVTPVRDISGNIRHLLIIQEDITNRVQSNEELKNAYDMLKSTQMQLVEAAKFESVGRLSAGVAHEVKNPLAVVIMGLEVLQNYIPDKDPVLMSVIDDIRKAVLRADHVVKGLLEFAAPKEGKMQAGDPHKVLQRSLDMLRFDINKNKIRVDQNFTIAPVKVMMDEAKLEQVFVNILVNAIQIMPEGGLIRIQTTLLNKKPAHDSRGRRLQDVLIQGKQFLAIWIEDTGTGIEEAQLEKIFDPFYTTKKPGEGTGLGLSVSRSIVDLHGGVIKAENRPEGGACFTLHLPVKEEESCSE